MDIFSAARSPAPVHLFIHGGYWQRFSAREFSFVARTLVAAGTTVNLVTKRGTNEFRGSARYMLTDNNGYFGLLEQGDSDTSDLLADGQDSLSGNSIGRITDLGFEAGGPLYRDRVWAWGSWGQNNIGNFAAGGTPDNTFLENTAIKLNGQVASNNSATASFNNGNKVKIGRSAGPTRPANTQHLGSVCQITVCSCAKSKK